MVGPHCDKCPDGHRRRELGRLGVTPDRPLCRNSAPLAGLTLARQTARHTRDSTFQPRRPRNGAVSGYSTDFLHPILTFTIRGIRDPGVFLERCWQVSSYFTLPVFMVSDPVCEELISKGVSLLRSFLIKIFETGQRS